MTETEIPIGSFGVVRTNSLVSSVIRFVTRSPVNHAVIYVGNGTCMEARPGGAGSAPITKYPNMIWVSKYVPDSNTGYEIATWAVRQAGVPYGWADILVLGLRQYGVTSKWVNKRIERMDRLICSQLVDKAYMMAGVHLFNDGRLTQDVTPGDLYDLR